MTIGILEGIVTRVGSPKWIGVQFDEKAHLSLIDVSSKMGQCRDRKSAVIAAPGGIWDLRTGRGIVPCPKRDLMSTRGVGWGLAGAGLDGRIQFGSRDVPADIPLK